MGSAQSGHDIHKLFRPEANGTQPQSQKILKDHRSFGSKLFGDR